MLLPPLIRARYGAWCRARSIRSGCAILATHDGQVKERRTRTCFVLTDTTMISQTFRHPGLPTEWIRCPDSDRKFEKGQGNEQRRWDQEADIWALGAMFARVVAEPWFSSPTMENAMRLVVAPNSQSPTQGPSFPLTQLLFASLDLCE
jgi:hypothetical protein